MNEIERSIYGSGLRGRLVKAAVERAVKKRIEERRVEEHVCLDCGIDLPATWHWDGCKRVQR